MEASSLFETGSYLIPKMTVSFFRISCCNCLYVPQGNGTCLQILIFTLADTLYLTESDVEWMVNLLIWGLNDLINYIYGLHTCIYSCFSLYIYFSRCLLYSCVI